MPSVSSLKNFYLFLNDIVLIMFFIMRSFTHIFVNQGIETMELTFMGKLSKEMDVEMCFIYVCCFISP